MNYKHTWTIDESSKLLRFYAWCWGADPHSADFCRLFWGLLFFPVALFGRLFAPLGRLLVRKVEKADAKSKRRPKDQTNKLDKIVVFFAKPAPRRAAKIIGTIVLVVGGLGIAALLVLGIIKRPLVFLIAVGVALVIVLLIVAIAASSEKISNALDVVARSLREVKRNTCPRVEVRESFES